MALANEKEYIKDLVLFVDPPASEQVFDVSGIEVSNIKEVRILGMASDSGGVANKEIWVRFHWKDLEENTANLPTNRQDMTGYHPVVVKGGTGFVPAPWLCGGTLIRTWKRADGRLPAHFKIDFKNNDGASLSHQAILWLRLVTKTAF